MNEEGVRSISSHRVIDIALQTEGLSLQQKYELLQKKLSVLTVELDQQLPTPTNATTQENVQNTNANHHSSASTIESSEGDSEESKERKRLRSLIQPLHQEYELFGRCFESFGGFSCAIHSDVPDYVPDNGSPKHLERVTSQLIVSSTPDSLNPSPRFSYDDASPPAGSPAKRRFSRRPSNEPYLKSPPSKPTTTPSFLHPEPPASCPPVNRPISATGSYRNSPEITDTSHVLTTETLRLQLAKAKEQIQTLQMEKSDLERERDQLYFENRHLLKTQNLLQQQQQQQQQLRTSNQAIISPSTSPTNGETTFASYSTLPLAPLQRAPRTPGMSSPRRTSLLHFSSQSSSSNTTNTAVALMPPIMAPYENYWPHSK
jgi:hypothetical protein